MTTPSRFTVPTTFPSRSRSQLMRESEDHKRGDKDNSSEITGQGGAATSSSCSTARLLPCRRERAPRPASSLLPCRSLHQGEVCQFNGRLLCSDACRGRRSEPSGLIGSTAERPRQFPSHERITSLSPGNIAIARALQSGAGRQVLVIRSWAPNFAPCAIRSKHRSIESSIVADRNISTREMIHPRPTAFYRRGGVKIREASDVDIRI